MFSFFSSTTSPVTPASSHPYAKRLAKEQKDLTLKPPDGIKIRETDSLIEWEIELNGAKDTLYENEQFLIRFR